MNNKQNQMRDGINFYTGGVSYPKATQNILYVLPWKIWKCYGVCEKTTQTIQKSGFFNKVFARPEVKHTIYFGWPKYIFASFFICFRQLNNKEASYMG